MDDNQIATSDDQESSHDPHFAHEVEDAPVDAPVGEESEPLDLRAQLAAAFEKQENPDAEETAAPAPAEGEETAAPAEPEAPKHKAPVSWKPEAQAAFDAVPDVVKQEIARRENDLTQTLSRTANERMLAQEFLRTAEPYENYYREKGLNPLQAAEQLFNLDRVMSSGTKEERSKVAANMLMQYGVDLEMLENDLIGMVEQKRQNPGVDPAIAQRLAYLEQQTFAQQQQQQQYHQQIQQQEHQSAINKIQEFEADPKNEFFKAVVPQMVALLNVDPKLDLKSAYNQACFANEEIRKVISQREQANKQRAAAGRLGLPNKGPRNGSSGQQGKSSMTLREQIEANVRAQEQGRV